MQQDYKICNHPELQQISAQFSVMGRQLSGPQGSVSSTDKALQRLDHIERTTTPSVHSLLRLEVTSGIISHSDNDWKRSVFFIYPAQG